MEVFSLLLFSLTFLVGYLTRNSGGIPLPLSETCDEGGTCWKRFDLWSYVVGDGKPETLKELLTKNLSTWFILYTVAHILTHVEPQRRLFKPFKFNPNYPPLSLVGKEIFRSARGVIIATIFESIINNQHARSNLPWVQIPAMFTFPNNVDGLYGCIEDPLFGTCLLAILILIWWDFHFYWTHRMLHTKWFYKNVHKIHHESYNPDPFSG